MLKAIKAVEKKRAYEDVVAQIRALIDDGRLKQGDQLPTERELSETFRVSRATIREAIRTLESAKLVQSRQGDGTYVLASSEETLVQTLAAVLFNEKDTIYDIFYVRKIIEPHVAELAAENATPGEIKELATLIMEHEESIAEGKSVTKYDSAFHGLLARMSKNPIMERLLSALVDLFEQTRGEYLQNDERAKKSFIGHHEVFTAIKSRDCTAARRAMSRHLEKVETIVMGKKRKGGGRH
jgi:GntR family transcriptional regulator, transcriptional repressor for pyruvate dehydrogenase complex